MPAPAIDMRRMFLALPTPYMMLDRELRFIDMNARYLETTDRTREDLLGRYVFDAFPEEGERLALFKSAFERAVAGEANSLIKKPFSIPRSEEQGGGMREVFWTCHHQPIHDAKGVICGMIQHAEDVTTEVVAERMREVISREFDHRVKNLLATISTIARRTAKTAASSEAFLKDFDARIAAMARTHELLVRGGWDGLTIDELVESELSPYREDDRRAVRLSGPAVVLTGRQAQTLGMALHELATNAAKYGALGAPHGRLDVDWDLDPGTDRLRLVWHERGLSGLGEPEAEGFGSTILDRVMPMELEGSVERVFLSTGLRCTIEIPSVKPQREPLLAAG